MCRLALILVGTLLLSGTVFSHDGKTTPFPLDTARENVCLAFAAASPVDELMEWKCGWCRKVSAFKFVDLLEDEEKNLRGYVGYVPNDHLVLSFRGTDTSSLVNWIVDLYAAEERPFPNLPSAFVHAGFYEAWESLESQTRGALDRARKECPACNNTLTITGHSLGGALAAMATTALGGTEYDVTLYTYGEPRVGNKVLADWIHTTKASSVWRFVHTTDIVAHLPPLWLGPWHHHPHEAWFNAGVWHGCDGSGEDPHCADSVRVYSKEAHGLYPQALGL